MQNITQFEMLDLTNLGIEERKRKLLDLTFTGRLKHAVTQKGEKVRLFLSKNDHREWLCALFKGASKNGFILSNEDIGNLNTAFVQCELLESEINKITIIKNQTTFARLRKIITKPKQDINNKLTRAIINADDKKSVVGNSICSGKPHSGELLSLKRAIDNLADSDQQQLIHAIETKQAYISPIYQFKPYRAQIELIINDDGEFSGYLSFYKKELADARTYALISNEWFICLTSY